jgi:hypothetical protein
MRANKSYLTLEKLVSASSVGISALELLFNSDLIIVYGSESDFETIKMVEELVYNKDYDEVYRILNKYRNG